MEIRKMKCLLFFCLLFAASVAYEDVSDDYINKFMFARDNVSLGQYFRCLVDRGPCDEFAQPIKNHINEVLSNGCDKCDDAQKHITHFFITTLRNDFPELYEAFEEKYDPDRTLLSKLDQTVKANWKR